MNGIYQLLLFNILFSLPIKSADTLCNMPSTWLGSWYQRGMNSLLEITTDHIQSKGRCLDVLASQQYYLFTDRITRCTRCLLFIERHVNLLQYRESECSDLDDLSSVTSCPNMIAPDAALYTLHRNDSRPQSCPIQPPFLLTSFIKDGSMCHQTISSSSFLGQCANDYQFRLHLSPCSSYQQTTDLQFACVGTWTEGFHTYFVTRILSTSPHPHQQNTNQYACFHYLSKQKDLSSFTLSMTTDDSCRDLNSKYMATVMTLSTPTNRQMDAPSNISCRFPVEFQREEWYSLNRTRRMTITEQDIDLIDVHHRAAHQRLHCVEQLSTHKYRVQWFTNCDMADRCLRLSRRTTNVLELVIETCDDHRVNSALTFVRKSPARSSCPTSIGRLSLQSDLNQYDRNLMFTDSTYHLSVGCDTHDQLITSLIDKDGQSPSTITQLDTCLASWQSDESSTIHLVAQSMHSNASYCLTFQMRDIIIISNHSQTCSLPSDRDDASISVYAAKLINPCSRSAPLSFTYGLLWMALLLSVDHLR